MSRVGKQPVALPPGVEVQLAEHRLTVRGPRGLLERKLHPEMRVEIRPDQILVLRPTDGKLHRSLHGLTRSLIQNMVQGVTAGFQKNLELAGVGYRAAKQGDRLVLTVGYSHPVEIAPPEGIAIEVPNPTTVQVKGNDKELVGQLAARIREVRPPEPYKGKGIRYAGEVVRRKVGKTGKK
ncbi:MAG: 50S ribosomal protein L6 [Thermaerobacter sp.]|nr:50S ribosomal protein L6 [Thermaerobacter sp.]MDA8146060.1 50S ribosomal protein L6 [Thermaerobacter sp.]